MSNDGVEKTIQFIQKTQSKLVTKKLKGKWSVKITSPLSSGIEDFL